MLIFTLFISSEVRALSKIFIFPKDPLKNLWAPGSNEFWVDAKLFT